MVNELRITPYQGVTGIALGSARGSVLQHAKPSATRKNRYSAGVTDFYNDLGIQLCFLKQDGAHAQSELVLKEISLRQGCGRLMLERLNFFAAHSDDVFDFLETHDPDFKDFTGMVFFPRFGLSIAGFGNEGDDNEGNDKVVTVYAKDRFDTGFDG